MIFSSMIFLFLFILLDMVHYLVFVRSTSLENYHAVFRLGQFVTIFCLTMGASLFILRLNFVRSTTGQYYESMLETSPEKVTRWRDEIDNLILRMFSKKHDYLKGIGRFDNDNDSTGRNIE